MNAVEADLLLMAGGRPVVVVETRALAAAPEWGAVRQCQLQALASATGSPWVLWIDPELVTLYRGVDTERAVVSIPTSVVLERVGLAGEVVVGENVLGMAAERWLPALPHDAQLLEQYPELGPFAAALRRADEMLRWVQLGYTAGYRVELDPGRGV